MSNEIDHSGAILKSTRNPDGSITMRVGQNPQGGTFKDGVFDGSKVRYGRKLDVTYRPGEKPTSIKRVK